MFNGERGEMRVVHVRARDAPCQHQSRKRLSVPLRWLRNPDIWRAEPVMDLNPSGGSGQPGFKNRRMGRHSKERHQ